MPDIAAIATKLTELDVVAMRCGALLEDENKLVLTAIKRAHPCIVLGPDAEILELAVGRAGGGQQFFEMAPVHADVVQRPGRTEGDEIAEGANEKSSEFGFVHLARCHRERTVMDRTEAARVTVDLDVVGRVCEDRGGSFRTHQCREGSGIKGAAAQEPMMAKKPEITELADQRPH